MENWSVFIAAVSYRYRMLGLGYNDAVLVGSNHQPTGLATAFPRNNIENITAAPARFSAIS